MRHAACYDPRMGKKKEPDQAELLSGALEQLGKLDISIPDSADLAKAIVHEIGGVPVVARMYKDIYTHKDTSQATKTRLYEGLLRLLVNVSAKQNDTSLLSHKTKGDLEAMLYDALKREAERRGEAQAPGLDEGGQAPGPDGPQQPPQAPAPDDPGQQPGQQPG